MAFGLKNLPEMSFRLSFRPLPVILVFKYIVFDGPTRSRFSFLLRGSCYEPAKMNSFSSHSSATTMECQICYLARSVSYGPFGGFGRGCQLSCQRQFATILRKLSLIVTCLLAPPHR